MIALNSTEQSLLEFSWRGLTSYQDSLLEQQEAYEKLLNQQDSPCWGRVFGLEHPSVITLGKRGNAAVDIKFNSKIEIVEVDRGGQATLHSPGQLVIYPVLDLRKLGLGVREYVETLEESTITTLHGLGIESFRGPQPGVFTRKGKLAFVGVRIRHGISSHGISINFSNDLALFNNISPCGMSQAQFDQIQNHKTGLKIQELFQIWSGHFRLSLQSKAGISLSSFISSSQSSLGVVGSAPP